LIRGPLGRADLVRELGGCAVDRARAARRVPGELRDVADVATAGTAAVAVIRGFDGPSPR
jgi:hypothetical protein